MKYLLDGTRLIVIAESTDSWSGSSACKAVAVHPSAGRVLRCGTVTADGKSHTLVIRLDDKPDLAALADQWLAAVAAADKAEETADQDAVDAIREGRAAVEIEWRDGEILSGHTAYGPAAELLTELGVAHWVAGWGCLVDGDLVAALGTEFSYSQAVEFARPAIEAKQAEAAEAKAELAAKIDAAKSTGKPVALRTWTQTRSVDGGEYLFACTEFVRGDGTTFTKSTNTY